MARLLRQKGLRARARRRFVKTTDSAHSHPVAPNVLERDFSPAQPNSKWAGDITYVWTAEGWLYLAVVLDLYSRKVVGWAMSDTLDRQLVLAALRMALLNRPAPELHHSDRGSQGGFNRSSQHSKKEMSRWAQEDVDARSGPGAHGCRRPAVHRWAGVSIDSASGLPSPEAFRVRRLGQRPACHR